MKTIGLIGGMSWESTLEYYRIINEEAARRLGGLHSAECLLASVDFAPVEALMREERWEEIGSLLAAHARRLEAAGAGLILIATNTMHLVAPAVAAAVSVPLLHIADAAGAELERRGVRRAALLGTRFTMEKDFYSSRLRKAFSVEALVPPPEVRREIDRIIFEELCRGTLRDSSRAAVVEAIEALRARGSEAVVLGCTELPLLIGQEDSPLPVFDTMRLHATAAVEAALS